MTINTNVNQRALWTDANGNTLGASFLYSSSSNTITPMATALPGTTAPPVGYGQFLMGDWGLSGVTASLTNPVYLSLSQPQLPWVNSATLWYSSNGTTWTQLTDGLVPATSGATAGYDLTFNGTYDSFSLTGASGFGAGNWGANHLDFGGYDYAVVCAPLPGDANLDGKVDINDLTIVLTRFGQSGVNWTTGDFNGDGRVDINDLTIVLTNYGMTSGAGIKAVPEPASVVLLGVGVIALLGFAKRRRAS